MKRFFAIALILFVIAGTALAVNDEALQHAAEAQLPAGLSEHEAEIYRQGYANGYYAALYPPDTLNVYILNNGTRRFHYPSCPSAKTIKEKNREEFRGSRDQLIARGYEPCGNCNP